MQIQTLLFSFFKELLISWKESLELLVNKRFWLVTLKGSLETYHMLFKKFWWLLLLAVGFDIFVRGFFNVWYTNGDIQGVELHVLVNILWFLLWCLMGTVLFLIVRSSLERKDYSYFLQHGKSYIWFVIVTGTIWLIRWYGIPTSKLQFTDYLFFLFNFPFISTVYFSPFLILYTFFYLDSKKSIMELCRRLWSTIIMVLYTYPLCSIIWYVSILTAFLMIWFGYYIFIALHGASLHYSWADRILEIIFDNITKLLLPWYICLLYMVYTKQVHDHYDRYV